MTTRYVIALTIDLFLRDFEFVFDIALSFIHAFIF